MNIYILKINILSVCSVCIYVCVCGGLTYIALCNIWITGSLGAGMVEWATVVIIVCVHKPRDMV